jgi:hypothetical protein
MAEVVVTPEDHTVNFTVKLQNATGRNFHWKLTGDGFTPQCVIGEKAEGLDKIESELVIPIILKGTKEVKDLKNFKMTIRENGPTGSVVATSAVVNVKIIIVTKPPEQIGIIPISVPFISDGKPSWCIDQGNYEFTVEETNHTELKADLDRWGFETGVIFFDKDGIPNSQGGGDWGPYHYDEQMDELYERTYWNATGDGIQSIWKEDDHATIAQKCDEASNPYKQSCVMPFILQKEIVRNGQVVGERDFSKLDLVTELRVIGADEFSQPWINDPVWGHRAYSGPQGNTMIDCPLYKNVTPQPGEPLAKDFRSGDPTVQKTHVAWFPSEGRGYLQIPLYQIGFYIWDGDIGKVQVDQLRRGYNIRMKLIIKERTTGEVVSGLVFTVMQNSLYSDNTDFFTDRWARMYLQGALGDVTRVSEISPLYWQEPQRWMACDYTPEPNEEANFLIVGLDHNSVSEHYMLTKDAPPEMDIPYFNSPEVRGWPLGMTIKNLNLSTDPVGAELHMMLRPMVLGQAFNPPINLDDIEIQFWDGPESYLDIFAVTEESVARWKGKRIRLPQEPLYTLSPYVDNPYVLVLKPTRVSPVTDHVLRTTIVINFKNGWWAVLDCDITRLPGNFRLRITGSTVTNIDLS